METVKEQGEVWGSGEKARKAVSVKDFRDSEGML